MDISVFRGGAAFGQAGVFCNSESPCCWNRKRATRKDASFLKIAKIVKLTRRQHASFLLQQHGRSEATEGASLAERGAASKN